MKTLLKARHLITTSQVHNHKSITNFSKPTKCEELQKVRDARHNKNLWVSLNKTITSQNVKSTQSSHIGFKGNTINEQLREFLWDLLRKGPRASISLYSATHHCKQTSKLATQNTNQKKPTTIQQRAKCGNVSKKSKPPKKGNVLSHKKKPGAQIFQLKCTGSS